jgi:hypothetical protein
MGSLGNFIKVEKEGLPISTLVWLAAAVLLGLVAPCAIAESSACITLMETSSSSSAENAWWLAFAIEVEIG